VTLDLDNLQIKPGPPGFIFSAILGDMAASIAQAAAAKGWLCTSPRFSEINIARDGLFLI